MVARQGSSMLARVDATSGAVEELTPYGREVIAGTAAADSRRWALTIGDATSPGDLYLFDAETHELKKLFGPNDAGCSQRLARHGRGALVLDVRRAPHPGLDHETARLHARRRSTRWCSTSTAARTPPSAPRSCTSSRCWRTPATWCCSPTRAAAPPTARSSATSSSITIPGDDYRDLMAGVDEVIKRGYVDARSIGGDRRQRRRPAHQLGHHPDHALRGRGHRSLRVGLGVVLLQHRLHAVHADLVPEAAVRGSAGVHRALSPVTYRGEDHDAAHDHPQRGRLARADRPGRGDVPARSSS